MARVYLVSDQAEIDRRRRARPGVLIEAWPDLHVGDLFWLGDDETRRVAYTADRQDRSARGLFWIGEASKAALDGIGEPIAWDLAIDEALVPIYYGRQLTDTESLPREDSLRARVLSAHAIAAVWATYDASGARVEYRPESPIDPTFYLRRPGGKTLHLFRALRTKAEAMIVMAELVSRDPEATTWAEHLPAQDFADLVKCGASVRPGPSSPPSRRA
jgi:hypothetical protein